jgi:hypothetical protein
MRLVESRSSVQGGHLAGAGYQAGTGGGHCRVTADGDGVVGHAGTVLLGELADRVGLSGELDRWAGRGQPERARHRTGQVLTDLAVMLADGGDCLSDLAALRDQPGVFGPVASTPTAWRVLERLAQRGERGLAGVRVARARARSRAWQAGAWVDGLLLVDLDATLITAHSDKQGAEGTYRHGFGFHPLGAWLDRGDGTGEPLAAILRPGNAGANTAADHIDVLDLPRSVRPASRRTVEHRQAYAALGPNFRSWLGEPSFTDRLTRPALTHDLLFASAPYGHIARPSTAQQQCTRGAARPPPPAAGGGAGVVADLAKLSLGQRDYYTDEIARDREEYLSGHGEAPGEWLGGGAASLGLSGVLTTEQFQAMFDGRHPAAGGLLGAAHTKNGLPAYDLVLRPPKEVRSSQ